jgi:hypothetical protein
MTMDIKVLHVNKNLIDVFWGSEGWNPHARVWVTKAKDGTYSLRRVSGTEIPFKLRGVVIKLALNPPKKVAG